MRTVEWLQPAAMVLAMAGIAVAAGQRRLVRRLLREGATSQARAAAVPRRSPGARFAIWRLRRAGVLMATAGDRFYLEPPALAAWSRRRRRRALVAVTVVVLAIAAVLWGTR